MIILLISFSEADSPRLQCTKLNSMNSKSCSVKERMQGEKLTGAFSPVEYDWLPDIFIHD